ncbi:uncharacterized protein LOC135480423 [Liolophura sinensis]|uniref:uncharacterized protein LOC135480423 n=1 Tax=Liolophura sinensis TaxID=3198878 RepID=UPI003159117D
MKRLKATIPLQSLVDRSKLMREKLVTVEDFRNLVGNSKNIKAFCYFVRFTDPSDPTVRVVECQLYVENVFISSAKTKIARCSMLDLSEPVWKRSPEKQDVLNDAYIRAWETFNSKTVNDICTSHRILREGEVPEGTFSYVGHGDGKFSPTNIASLVRMKHPYKPSIRSSLSDLILMSSDDATSFQILRRSCNQSGLLLEMESQLKQFLTTNTIICKLFIAKKFIAQGKGGSKEAAWVDCSNSALEKLKKTKSYIKIKPNTSKEPLMTWEVFKAQAESWYTAQGLPDPTPDKPDPNPDISVAEETPQKTNKAVTENPYLSEPSNNNVTSGANTKSEAPVVAYTTRKGLAATETTQPVEPTVKATVSSTGNNLTTPGVGVYNSETAAGGNTTIQTSSQYSFDYTNYNPQFSFVYDAQGYCYILDSSGQYTPYTAQAHAMYYNMYSGQYGQASTGQYTVPGSENYSTQTFGQYGTWGTDGNANPLGGYGQTPGTQMQTTTAQPPATPPTKGRWDLSVKVPKTMSEAKTAQNYRNCNDTKGQRKAHRLLSSGVLVPRKGKFIHWREPLAPVNKKVLMYLEDRLIKRRKVDTLEEMYICSGMPLAERQALENLCLKYDFKLIMHGADHKISVIRWFSAQETFACLKRNNNVSGRTILVAEKGVPTGLE